MIGTFTSWPYCRLVLTPPSLRPHRPVGSPTPTDARRLHPLIVHTFPPLRSYTSTLLLDTSGTATASPFVIAIQSAGIQGLPSVVNAVILLSTVSASSSYLYAASRTLFGLATDKQAPAIFRRVLKNGLPVYAVAFTASFSLLAFMNVSSNGGTVFSVSIAPVSFLQNVAKQNDFLQWLYTLSALSCLLSWICIFFTYLRFYAGESEQPLSLPGAEAH